MVLLLLFMIICMSIFNMSDILHSSITEVCNMHTAAASLADYRAGLFIDNACMNVYIN